MDDVAALLGLHYDDLLSSAIFRGQSIPPRETIVDRAYVSAPGLGISLVLCDGETIDTVQLHGDGCNGFSEFRGDLPRGISFGMSRAEIRKLLGPPQKSGEAGEVPILGAYPSWDAYSCDGLRLHCEYDFDERRIRLVSISSFDPDFP